VSEFQDRAGAFHGFLLDDGTFTQINFPGATATSAAGINDRGQIVGIFQDAAGAAHSFLASKEHFNGKASGLGSGEGKAAVETLEPSLRQPISIFPPRPSQLQTCSTSWLGR
jgi:probable HAF family extracellular repeat protein